MNEQDFNKVKEILKELNDIRLRNNLTELKLQIESGNSTYYEHHKEWVEVMLLTRDEHKYKDCKVVYVRQDKNTNIIQNIDYEEYINYNGIG